MTTSYKSILNGIINDNTKLLTIDSDLPKMLSDLVANRPAQAIAIFASPMRIQTIVHSVVFDRPTVHRSNLLMNILRGDITWCMICHAPLRMDHAVVSYMGTHLSVCDNHGVVAIRDGANVEFFLNEQEFIDAIRNEPDYLATLIRLHVSRMYGFTIGNIPNVVVYSLPHEITRILARAIN